MSYIIPLVLFNPENQDVKRLIRGLNLLSTIAPEAPIQIPVEEETMLIPSNLEKIKDEISPSAKDRDIKTLVFGRKNLKVLSEIIPKLEKYEENINYIENRFKNTKKKYLRGVGVDGSNFYPVTPRQERDSLDTIKESVGSVSCGLSGAGEIELFDNAVMSTMYWQNYNMVGFPLGSPLNWASYVPVILGKNGSGKFDITMGSQIRYPIDLVKNLKCCSPKLSDRGIGSKIEMFYRNHPFRQCFQEKPAKKSDGTNKPASINFYFDKADHFVTGTADRLLNFDVFDIKKLLSGEGDNKLYKMGLLFMHYILMDAFYNYQVLCIRFISLFKSDKFLLEEYSANLNRTLENYKALVNYCIRKFFGVDVGDNDFITMGMHVGAEHKIEQDTNIYRLYTGVNEKDNLNIGFKDPDFNGNILNEDNFLEENFPIVFEYEPSSKQISGINYNETRERLAKFLTQTDPTHKDGTPIALGAPGLNTEIMICVASQMRDYFRDVVKSKNIVNQYLDNRIKIFQSGIPAKDIIALRDELDTEFEAIQLDPSPLSKEKRCASLVNKIIRRYANHKKMEVKFSNDARIKFALGKSSNVELSEVEWLDVTMNKVYEGNQAYMLDVLAKICFQMNAEKHGGRMPCSSFLTLYGNAKALEDKKIEDLLKKQFAKELAKLTKILGNTVIPQDPGLGVIVAPPSEYLTKVLELLGQPGMQVGIPGAPMGTSGPYPKKEIKGDERIRIESGDFWRDLNTMMEGRRVYLPLVNVSSETDVYRDSSFRLMDLMESMKMKKLIAIKLPSLTLKNFYSLLGNKAYIMFCAETANLDNPQQWRLLSYQRVNKLYRSNKVSMKRIRNIFFNLIANNGFMKDNMNIALPEESVVSKKVRLLCEKGGETKYSKCAFVLSREQLGKTLQGKMGMSAVTKGIDLASGTSFSTYSPVSRAAKDILIKR